MQEDVKKQLAELERQLLESECALDWNMSPPQPPFVIKQKIAEFKKRNGLWLSTYKRIQYT